jgi:hypothetical protein
MNYKKQIDGETTTYTLLPYSTLEIIIGFFIGSAIIVWVLLVVGGTAPGVLAAMLLLAVFVLILVNRQKVILTSKSVTFPQSLGGKTLLFSNVNMHINIFWTELYLTQKEVEFLGIKIWLEIKDWPEELLGDLFSRLPLDTPMTTSRYPKALSLSDEHKAAAAFFWLDSSKPWQALIARQMLISLIKKEPGYLFPKDAPEQVSLWKKWLADEFQERFEVSVFQLERATIKRILPEIALLGLLVWAGCEFNFARLRETELIIAVLIFGAGLLTYLSLFRIGPLIRLKGMARAMQRWRAEARRLNP